MNGITKSQWLYIGGRKVAKLRNWGTLCDIRRRNNGFLFGGTAVAVNEALLESLGDAVVLQFTNLDSGDVWTTTVRDFLNHTRHGKKPRRNELMHIEAEPEPPQIEQLSLL